MADYSPSWRRPEDALKIRNMKSKKRALQDRFFDGESPSKKSKRSQQQPKKKSFVKLRVPPDEQTNDDSTLMDLLNFKQPMSTSSSNNFSSSLTMSPSSPASTSSMSPHRPLLSNFKDSNHSLSPIRSYLPSLSSLQVMDSPPNKQKRRQQLKPAPAPSSPSWSKGSADLSNGGTEPKLRGKDLSLIRRLDGISEVANTKDLWHKELCLDWSLKTKLLILSSNVFGWSSNNLKTSEESSGISAFVRCIDIEPGCPTSHSPNNSQLDTSLGAQFHQCCLYWQHPYLPTVNLFPREGINTSNNTTGTATSSPPFSNLRLEDKVLEYMHSEWIEAFRSAFQLLRTRQCPFFYVCANQFTCLFCAAGTQGNDHIQVYVTPSTKGFRAALKVEGIEFSLPYYVPEPKSDMKSSAGNLNASIDSNEDSDDEPDKWLNEMGISQGLSVSISSRLSPTAAIEEKNKSTLVIIAGGDTLTFFNFLINSKNFLVSPSGQFAGMPPTILGPVAFHGATLRALKVKQSKVKSDKGDILHSIEMSGPVLPHMMHMLCSLLSKTVQNFKIQTNTLRSTKPLNLNACLRQPFERQGKASVFEMQNLSDCGLKKAVLDIFCRCDNCDTINDRVECRNSLFQWS